MASLVTTKQGDQGVTKTLGGQTVSKSDIIMEVVGTIDELRAVIGIAKNCANEGLNPQKELVTDILEYVSHVTFLIASRCSDPHNKFPEYRKYELQPAHIQRIEQIQSQLESSLELPRAFIVCASSLLSSYLDLACAVARRVERRIVQLALEIEAFDDQVIRVFMNRLSDLLFILARSVEGNNFQVVDYSKVRV